MAGGDEIGRKNSLKDLSDFAASQFSVRNLSGDENVKKLVDDFKTIKDDETITKLANGIRRFKLPEGYQFLHMYAELGSYELGNEYEFRYQFEKAAAAYGKTGHKEERDRILNPCVTIDGTVPAVSERHRSKFTITSRNAKGARCSLRRVDEAKWRFNLKTRIKNGETEDEWWLFQPIVEEAFRYCGDQQTNELAKVISTDAKTWKVPLECVADHSDRRTEVSVPFDLQAGTYLLEVTADGGNTARALLNVESLALVQENYGWFEGGTVRVVDAETGEPVSGAKVHLFAWQENEGKRKFEVIEEDYETDEKGACKISAREEKKFSFPRNAFLEVTTKDGQTGMMTLNMWGRNRDEDRSDLVKNVILTDRPVYRPGDVVHYRAWQVKATYEKNLKAFCAERDYELYAGDDSKWIFKRKGELDSSGGTSGEFKIPEDAKLGVYTLNFEIRKQDFMNGTISLDAGVNFRVEEYRKPEFSVSVETPKVALKLGDQVTATVKAKYYYGEPVKRGTAKVTVRRTPRRISWYPTWEWDWLYGDGCWWWFYDADWYEGPGCLWICRPSCTGGRWWRPTPEPETVVSLTVPLDEKGEAKVTWDTALVRKLYGDDDQEYSLSVSVTDASRRTIDGAGSVVVRAEPFRVMAWTDRPRYRVGDKVSANVHLDGLEESEVEKKVWTLYDLDGKRIREVESAFSATQAGQFRLSCAVTDKKGTVREGSRIIQIIGKENDGRDFRYAALELIPDQRAYAPGETVRLAINSEHANGTVFVRVRKEETQVVKLQGKTATIEVPVTDDDQPNFFIEAWTVFADRYYREKCEILVPPVSKVGKATVEIGKEIFHPGETVTALVKVFDENGKPCDIVGAMSVYDKSIDALAGGSNIGPLAQRLWGWKRYERMAFVPSCGRSGEREILHFQGDPWIYPLGLFGSRAMMDGRNRGTMRLKGRVAKMRMRSSPASLKVEAAPMAMMMADAAVPEMACEDAACEAPEEASESDSGVRKNFADTAYWNSALEATGTQGVYRVSFKMPEDITGWNVKVWTLGAGGRVAEVATEIVTKKDLMLRLQAPRFFTEKDEVVLSANLHNYGSSARSVRATLDLSGVNVTCDTKPRTFDLAAGGEARADWRVKINASGKLKIRMRVTDGKEADGVEKEIDVVSHAIEKTESVFRRAKNGWTPGVYEGLKGIELYTQLAPLPKGIARGTCAAVVEVSDTLADAIDQSLPYLKYYEYECTEQTMNRFVPAAVARQVLKERKLEANLKDVDDLIAKGLNKLGEHQNSDGGWGWFYGSYEHSYEYMTALVVRGLAAAKASGVEVLQAMLARGRGWLIEEEKRSLEHQKKGKYNPSSTDVITCWALLSSGSSVKDKTLREMLDRAYAAREELPFYAKAMLGLCFDLTNDIERRAMMVRNLKQFLKTDAENGTAYFDLRNGDCWWYWWGNDLEAQSVALMLLVKAEPESDVTRGLALYLHNNRKNRTHWTNTRDTGLAIEALASYCERIEKNDRRNRYISGYLTYTTLEEPIAAAGLEVKVNRAILRVVESVKDSSGRGASGQVVAQQRTKEKLEPLADGATVKAGEILEIRLDVETKNDYEYLLIEDRKGAGFEPVDFQSGYKNLGGAWAYVEFREKKTALFLREMPRGVKSLTYRVRVETPGTIHILPARIEAMYAPKLKGNSEELRLKVEER